MRFLSCSEVGADVTSRQKTFALSSVYMKSSVLALSLPSFVIAIILIIVSGVYFNKVRVCHKTATCTSSPEYYKVAVPTLVVGILCLLGMSMTCATF